MTLKPLDDKIVIKKVEKRRDNSIGNSITKFSKGRIEFS